MESGKKIPVTKRFYRDFYSDRLETFYVKYKFTDLCIRVDKFEKSMLGTVYDLVKTNYEALESYINIHKEFYASLVPVECLERVPDIVLMMDNASKLADVGPMASVAGAFADIVGNHLVENYRCEEVVVENGGDIYIRSKEPIKIGIFANFNSEFNKLLIVLPSGSWGVCTSSGKIGHSRSFGSTDATCVIAKTSVIADAFATRYGNIVHSSLDFEKLEMMVKEDIEKENILGAISIVNSKLFAIGNIQFSV